MTITHPLFGTTISTYTRAQAIADGALVDITSTVRSLDRARRRATITAAVAITAEVNARLDQNELESEHRHLALALAREMYLSTRDDRADSDTIRFDFDVIGDPDVPGAEDEVVTLVARVHCGDRHEPVITVSLA